MYSSVLLIIVFFLTGDLWYSVKPVGGQGCECVPKDMDCDILTPSPAGFKCHCVMYLYIIGVGYSPSTGCLTKEERCRADEDCPGGVYDYPRKCDCNQFAYWRKGYYDVVGVDYDEHQAEIYKSEPKVVAIKEVPNHTSVTQSSTLVYQEKVTELSIYQYTAGIQLDIGISFSAGIPFLAEAKPSFLISPSFSHTWGTNESKEKMIEGRFTCNSAPYKLTQCSVTMRTAMMGVPYVMQLKHKTIPDCVCESRGVWKGTQVFNTRFVAKPLGNCRNGTCDNQ